jgi:iron complex outermembrane recepter protein
MTKQHTGLEVICRLHASVTQTPVPMTSRSRSQKPTTQAMRVLVCWTAVSSAALLVPTQARAAQDDARALEATPPIALHRIDPKYPERTTATDDHADVLIKLSLDATGAIVATEVAQSGGALFDTAALESLKGWRFAPAVMHGRAVASTIRVPFHFERPALPAAAATPSTGSAPHSAASVQPTPTSPTAAQSAREVVTPEDVHVTGHSYIPNRGGADLDITVGQLSKVPRQDAAAFLRMAPGLMLTNQGGTGHPYQIFLRGFDAREGQDIEFAVDGIPINEVGNPHGNGLADTHFILPELVQSLRVIEGPYAPQQGNFAVAGSALYDVGLKDPGLTAKAMYGSFGTKRLVLLWKPSSATSHTFAGAELFSSSGFGQNRASSRATAMAGYEIPLGRAASLRLLATSYATGYQQAGVLREDDVLSGRKGFYDTNDTTQGGDVARHSVGMTLDAKDGDMRYMQSVFATYRASRIRQNFTGFREDPQQSWQSTHPQRGDLIDQQSTAVTVGARGSARHRFRAFERPQDLEFGYFARFDSVDGLQQRDRADTNIPYRGELDLSSSMSNLGLYVDASIKPLAWLTVRGGARADLFHYKVTNRCAVTTRSAIAGGVPDTECFSADRQGYRSPDQTATAVTTVLQPRAVVLMGPWDGITISASYGRGTRSLDPQYVNQGAETPFATVHSGELGVLWNKSMGAVTASIRTAFFSTYVDRDLFFNQTEGRNTLANGTSRTGFSAYSRFTGKFFDVAGSVTLVKSRFDDTGLAVPYSPGFVARLDGTVFGDTSLKLADHAIEGSIGAGISIVGPRPLPFNERTNVQGLIDIAASAKWRSLSLGATCTNLLGREYRLGEFNYTSDFRSRDYPTQVAARHFSAGEPRAVYLTLGITLAPSTDRPPSPAAAPSTPATSLERKTP